MLRSTLFVVLGVAMALVSCHAAETKPAGDTGSFRGWYMERSGEAYFQPCASSEQWRISGAADLPARARRFGLEENTPVYVVVAGVRSSDTLRVQEVTQFGSPVPVRDCAMSGVVIPAPAQH